MGLALSVVNRVFNFFNFQFDLDYPEVQEQRQNPRLHNRRPPPDAIYPAPPVPQPLSQRVGRTRLRDEPERRRSRHELRARNEPEGRPQIRDEPEGRAGGRNEPEGTAEASDEPRLIFLVEPRSLRRHGSRCRNHEREHRD